FRGTADRRTALMFAFLRAQDAAGRMDELERFLEYWYGPRRSEDGEPEEALNRLPLPMPLRRFYAAAGRRLSPDPEWSPGDYFYLGGAGHHLQTLDAVELLDDGRLNFFMEYQVDWYGLTLPDADDPPVWIRGCWDGDDGGEDAGEEEDDERIRQVSGSLSTFLVTHCLMTTLYETGNYASSASERDQPLVAFFERNRERAVHLADAGTD